jgi:cyclopropane fatty-acyl-phospholipid synthase-like methyltransferase
MLKYKFLDTSIKLSTSKKVFVPNLTTQAILECCNNLNIANKKKILDLGSGSGIIGIFLKKKFKKKVDLYLSDYSSSSISNIKSNLKLNNIRGIAKKSNVLDAWGNEKFDLIINDISAIDKNIANKYWYNKFIPHDCGDDGLKLSKEFLNTVEKNLMNNGIILMPVISISNHKLLIKILKKKFKTKLLITKEWPAPKNMIKGKVANFLKKEYIFKKYNTYLCFTKILKIKKR